MVPLGNDVIFLDPHTTQQIGMLPNKDIETEHKIDNSYHCQQINRLPILNMDPSLAAVSCCNQWPSQKCMNVKTTQSL